MGTMQQRHAALSQFFLLACALVGVGIAAYLTSAHYELAPLACSGSGFVNCARVLSSPYSVVPGTSIPISIPGMAWSLLLATLVVMELRRPVRWLRLAQFAWSLVGMLTVLYLVYVEIVLLHNLCAWCTAMHVLIFLIFLISLARLPSSQPERVPDGASARKPTEMIRPADRR